MIEAIGEGRGPPVARRCVRVTAILRGNGGELRARWPSPGRERRVVESACAPNLTEWVMFAMSRSTRPRASITAGVCSKMRMRVLIDRTLAEVRLDAGANRRERVSIAELIEVVAPAP